MFHLKSIPFFFLSTEEKKKILEAVRTLEKESSAELRVHIERSKKNVEVLIQAQQAFERLGMTRTKERSGVLIYVCPDSKRFSVLGDTGIHEKVSGVFWAEITREMEARFRENQFSEGIADAVSKIGQKLKVYFPRKTGDINELPDHISY